MKIPQIFWASAFLTSTSAIPANPCATRMRLARDWESLSQGDKERFVSAFHSLTTEGVQDFADIMHFHAIADMHNTEGLFPGHRYLLVWLMEQLSKYGWTEGIPYVDFPAYKEKWRNDSAFWDLLGGLGDEETGSLHAGPLAGQKLPVDNPDPDSDEYVWRDPNWRVYDDFEDRAAMKMYVEGSGNLKILRKVFETFQHARVHVFLGGSQLEGKMWKREDGTEVRGTFSPADIFFWLHHSWTDLIWSQFQMRSEDLADESFYTDQAGVTKYDDGGPLSLPFTGPIHDHVNSLCFVYDINTPGWRGNDVLNWDQRPVVDSDELQERPEDKTKPEHVAADKAEKLGVDLVGWQEAAGEMMGLWKEVDVVTQQLDEPNPLKEWDELFAEINVV